MTDEHDETKKELTLPEKAEAWKMFNEEAVLGWTMQALHALWGPKVANPGPRTAKAHLHLKPNFLEGGMYVLTIEEVVQPRLTQELLEADSEKSEPTD